MTIKVDELDTEREINGGDPGADVQVPVQEQVYEAEEVTSTNEGAEEDSAEEPKTIDPLEEALAQNADLKDKWLRALAEMENLRRRTAKELKEVRDYSIAAFALEMLRVNDSLNLALSALPEIEEGKACITGSFVEGLKLVARQLTSTMERVGVKKFSSFGEKFDPRLHNAVSEVPTEDATPGTVVQVLEEGFYMKDRVLRPASVAVSKVMPTG